MSDNFDGIIIGAGPAGSSAAILLAQRGWRVALVEKLAFPRRKVCGECIAASNLPLLHALGVGEAVLDMAGPPLRRLALERGDQTIHTNLPRFADNRAPWGMALGREYLDTLLLEQAKRCGVTVFQPWAVHALQGEAGDLRSELINTRTREARTLAAPVVIAAYGSWELSPAAIQPQRPRPESDDLFAFKANFADAAITPGTLSVLAFPGGYGGMVLGDHDTATVAFCIRRDTLSRCRKSAPQMKAAEAAMAYVSNACRGVRNAVASARQIGPWLSVGPLRPGIRMPRQGGRAFVIGNAAGEAHPIIGEGMSMAIQSAWLLAEALAGRKHDMADRHQQLRVQQHYAQTWQRHFAPRIHLASVLANVAMRPHLIHSAWPWLERFPGLLTHAARWSGKVRCPPLDAPGNGLSTPPRVQPRRSIPQVNP